MTTKKTQPKAVTAPKADDSAKAPEAGDAAAAQEPVKDPAAKDSTPDDQGSAKAPEAGGAAASQEPAKDAAAKEGTSSAQGGAKTAAKAKRKVLKVTALAESLRRANLQFSRKTRTLYQDDLSEAQVKAIKAEPRLSVVESEE